MRLLYRKSPKHRRYCKRHARCIFVNMQSLHDERMTRIRDEHAQVRDLEVTSVERRTAMQVNDLLASHERAISDMRSYFRELTSANLDLISALKEEKEELRRRDAVDEHVMVTVSAENKRMSEPLRLALDEVCV